MRSERWEAAGQSAGDELEDPLGLGQVLEAVQAEVAERGRRRFACAHELMRAFGDDHLAAVRGRRDPRSAVDVDADVVAVGYERLARV